MPVVVTALLLAGAGNVTLAAPALNAINLDPKLVQFYGEHLAQHLGASGVVVKTQKDIEAMLGLERQKQLLGCTSDESSCAAELAGALGADGMLLGDIAKVASAYQINLKVISSTGQLLASYSARTEDEETMLSLLTQGAHSLARELYPRLGRGDAPAPVAVTVVARGGQVKRFFWVPAAAGLALLGVGVVLVVLTDGEWSKLHPAPGTTIGLDEAGRAVTQGKSYQLWSAVLLSTSVACVAAAAGMYLFGGESAKVTAMLGPDGGSVGIAGVW
jgi:hypothetical protein